MNGNPLYLAQQFMQFRNSFRGNPQQQVQMLLNSGQITQEQYNQAVIKAQELQAMLSNNNYIPR